MSPFWQAKIWGLLHDPALKALHRNMSREGRWDLLRCMQGWKSPKDPSTHPHTTLNSTWLKYVGLCDLIASASDRATVGRLPARHSAVGYDSEGLQIRHLLSGKEQTLRLQQWHNRLTESNPTEFLGSAEQVMIFAFYLAIQGGFHKLALLLLQDYQFLDWAEKVVLAPIRKCEDPQKVFWWLWRCYPQALSTALGAEAAEPHIPLLPAETRLPDASLWSHVTMTSALAGGLAGYYDKPEAYPKKGERVKRKESRPHVATFSFTPVQELIKASRKMRDFWAGSWLLHYLSAKVCWAIAEKYGPDTLLYPCLYAQPLIDHWLLQKYPDFKEWIKLPSPETWKQKLLTAGFPNVLVMILPDNGEDPEATSGNPVRAAMAYAEETLKNEWKSLGQKVFDFLKTGRGQGGEQWRNIAPDTWDGWLKEQWQTYWVALPIGHRQAVLHHSPRQEDQYQEWIDKQNEFACPKPALFVETESKFLETVFKQTAPENGDDSSEPETREKFKARQPNMNVGSWWASIFDQTRFGLNAIKNARTWQLPTAFGPRSTVSGIGPVVHSHYTRGHWVTEGETEKFWSFDMGLFDGIEKLNATEVLKRGLHQILLGVLFPGEERESEKVPVLYPDLSSGVAGWLRQMERKENQEAIDYFLKACEEITGNFSWTQEGNDAPATLPWGIPWVAQHHPKWPNPRLLNAGWLIEDYQPANPTPEQPLTLSRVKELKSEELRKLRENISQLFAPGNNPTDWYVLAAGDGDGMGEWLKGGKLESYSNYIPDALHRQLDKMPAPMRDSFQEFLQLKKRMGPATHSALSRALLDFSNQLVPYLTEQRYAGRLIYGGGDDVLAYTNLWEWDSWLWDIRQCFRGADDPNGEFKSAGDYWRWNGGKIPENLSERPLFTMGHTATISFGIVIASHSVPLAIALENLWEAEKGAKDHKPPDGDPKDAVQVRVLYGNGNVLTATAKFDVFQQWKTLSENRLRLESAIFEQAANLWVQHPAPVEAAIAPWTKAFCSRREALKGDGSSQFQADLAEFIRVLWQTTPADTLDREVQSWLKLAAFVLRSRDIKLGGSAAS
jgi:CRISPR-associated protein Cmr2